MTINADLRQALKNEKPLQIIGVPNAYTAIMAQDTGFRAIYLSGAGISNLSFGLPDTGLTSLNDVAEETRRISSIVKLPLLVDIDTGWDNIGEAVLKMQQAGASAVHIEDQVFSKKCGHLPGKKVVSTEEMCNRIKEAIRAKANPGFIVMARTDALAVEGFEKTIERAKAYQEAGADAFFAEAFTDLQLYHALKQAISIPILANMTEFGRTPLFTVKQLGDAGVDMVLYPLSAARAMNKAALDVMRDIRSNGTQTNSVEKMQTREELYRFLKYEH